MTDYTYLVPTALVVAAIFALTGLGLWLCKVLDDSLEAEIESVIGPRRCGSSYGTLRCDRAAGHDLPHADSRSGRERPVQWTGGAA